VRSLPFTAIVLGGLFSTTLAGAETMDFQFRIRPAPARTTLLTSPTAPRVPEMSSHDRERLWAGDTVSKPLRFRWKQGEYVGGVSYQKVRALPHQVLRALEDVRRLPWVLPRTKTARLVARRGKRSWVELTQGNAWVEATYTAQIVRVSAHEVRFWLDPTRAHDVDDVWGFFRVYPMGRLHSLVTVAVALDVGDGIVRMLFEDRIQSVILSASRHIRDAVETHDRLAAR